MADREPVQDGEQGGEPGSTPDDARDEARARDELLDRIELRALREAGDEHHAAETLDLLETLRFDPREEGPPPAPDLTLGGYIRMHDRPPAFEGADGQPYTVAIDVEPAGADAAEEVAGARFAGFLVFVRWAGSGAGILEHVESGDLAHGATEDEARLGVLDLSLYEVKAELDAAIQRRSAALED
jgi:hypothetical protein